MKAADALSIAVIGAGPAGLSLALQAARALPQAHITVFDARAADKDVSGDPRTLALSLGSVHSLQALGVWDDINAQGRAEPITEVHVSQQQPALLNRLLSPLIDRVLPERLRPSGEPEVVIRAADEGVAQLGAVLSYGALVAPLQAAWLALQEQDAGRLSSRFGTRVRGFKPVDGGVEVDADIVETFGLAVVAEGGVFADQPAKTWQQGLSSDYRQTAWVGQVRIERTAADASNVAGAAGAAGGTTTGEAQTAERGVAYERFTPHGPAALLPLPPLPGDVPHVRRAALVWCVGRDEDPVAGLDPAQRLLLLNTVFHPRVGRIVELSPLKAFPLGLNAEWRLVQRGEPLGPGSLGKLGEPPRIVRIGNAAQTLHPVAGQGLNLGLRDVHELVDALSRSFCTESALKEGLGEGADPAGRLAAALRRFELRRKPDRWALIGATDFLARSFTWPVPALATLRGLGLAALQAAGPLKSGLARHMMFGRR